MSKAIIDFEKGDISALKEISDALQTIIDKEGAVAEQWKQVLTAMNSSNATTAASNTKVALGIEQIANEQKDLAAQVNTTGTAADNQNKSNIASNKKLSDSIDEVAQSQKEVAAQSKTTGVALDTQNKTSIDGTNKLAQSIEQIAVASKSMDKVVIGGAYKNYLQQIQQQLGLTSKELVNYIQNARQAAQAAVITAGSDEKAKEFTLSIQVMNDTLKQLGVTEDGTGTKTQSLRQKIKEAKDELVAMAEAGLQGTPAFQALQDKAGKLDDQMRDLNASIKNTGSDTKNIDGVISLMTGVAAGYSVAQGAAALFGDENEEVTKSLNKLMAAMNILNGLQQFALVIQKESAASILFTRTARVAETAAIEGEKVAQEGLNTAMEANPVGLIIIGLTALIAVISSYESSENKSAEATKKLNDLLSEQYTLSSDLNNIYPSLNQKLKENLDLQLKILAATDAPAAEQLKKKQEIAAVTKEIAQQEVERLKTENGALEDNQKKLDEIDKKLLDYTQRQAEIQKLKGEFADKGMEITAAEAGAINAQLDALEKIPVLSQKSVDALKSQQTFLSKVVSDQKTANVVLNNAISDTSTLSAEELHKQFTDGLRSATAFADALVSQRNLTLVKNQVDSIASIKAVSDAEIAAIRQKQQEDLKSNSNNTPGEKAKINADADLAVALNKKKLQQDIDNSELAGIQAKLTLAKAGSLEEYNYKIELINKTQEQELSATQLTQNQIDAIYAKHQKERQDADKLFEQSKLQDQISLDNADIDRFGISGHDKLLLTLNRLNDQEKLEISQANGNQKKIAEIEAKYNKLFKDTEISSNAEVMNKKIAAYQVYHDERMKMDQQIASDESLNENVRINALKDLQTQQIAQVDIEMQTNQENFNNHLILEKDFNEQYQNLLNKKRDISQSIERQITQIEKQEIDKRVAQMQSLFDFFKKGFEGFLPQSAFTVALSSLGNFSVQATKIFSNLKQKIDEYNKIIFSPDANAAEVLQAAGEKKLAQQAAVRQAEIEATQTAQNVVNQIYADGSAQRQQQLQDDLSALETERSAELANTNLNKRQQAAINKKFDDKEKQTKLAAWKADQAAKKETAIINGLLALARTYAEYGFTPAGWIMAAAQAVATGIIVAEISSQKPPKFRHGQIDIQGPGTTTSDSIPSLISRGESVIKADSTAKWKEALVAINNDHFEDYLNQKFKNFIFPSIPENVPIPTGKTHEIDYDKLATAMAEKMKGVISSSVKIENTMDENGLHSFVQKGNTRTEWKNKRFSMK